MTPRSDWHPGALEKTKYNRLGRRMSVLVASCTLAALTISVSPASPPEAPSPRKVGSPTVGGEPTAQVPTIRLQVSLTPLPPSYQAQNLLPSPAERRPGNAAVDYLRALVLLAQLSRDIANANKQQQQLDEWLSAPLERLPVLDIEMFLRPYADALRALETGARRKHCHWQLEEYLSPQNTSLLLEDTVHYRRIMALLRLRLRYHLARGDLDAAWRDWQTGWQFGRDVAQSPTLIRMLLGIALLSQMLDAAHDWMQVPSGFNLRDALAGLPRPLFDPMIALEGEAAFIRSSLPQPPELERDVLPAAEALRLLADSYRIINQGKPSAEQFIAAYAAQHGAAARIELVQLGRPREFVDRLSDAQAVALRNSLQMRTLWNSYARLFRIPYAAGESQRQHLQQQSLAIQKRDDVVLRLFGLSLPAVAKCERAFHRLDRRHAALLVVETLRLHAFQIGELPESLDTPGLPDIPVDPWTGKSFLFQRTPQGFRLSAPPVGGDEAASGKNFVYDVTIRAKK